MSHLTKPEDTTVLGVRGPSGRGFHANTHTWRWVAGRFGPAGENVHDIWRPVQRRPDSPAVDPRSN